MERWTNERIGGGGHQIRLSFVLCKECLTTKENSYAFVKHNFTYMFLGRHPNTV